MFNNGLVYLKTSLVALGLFWGEVEPWLKIIKRESDCFYILATWTNTVFVGSVCDFGNVLYLNFGNNPKNQLRISVGTHQSEAGKKENQVTWVILDKPQNSFKDQFSHP